MRARWARVDRNTRRTDQIEIITFIILQQYIFDMFELWIVFNDIYNYCRVDVVLLTEREFG